MQTSSSLVLARIFRGTTLTIFSWMEPFFVITRSSFSNVTATFCSAIFVHPRVSSCFRIRYPALSQHDGINLLFRKDYQNNTPIQIACKRFLLNDVMNDVCDVLARYADTTPINASEASLFAAANENSHLDCLYFLFQREPNLFIKDDDGFYHRK